MANNNRFSVSANGLDKAIWGFSLNPIGHSLRPERKQNLIDLIDGSCFIIEASNDSTILTLEWRNVPEEDYGTFIFGNSNELKFEKVFLYYASNTPNPLITDMTYQAYNSDTINMPFADFGNNLEEVSMNQQDRIFIGLSEQFNGILFDFEDYHSYQCDSDGYNYIDNIRLRFSNASGNLASADSLTYDGITNTEDDDTEVFQHYGQLRWSLSQVTNWEKNSLDNILSTTSEFTAPTGFSSADEYYYVEVQLNPDTTITTVLNPKIQCIKVGLDSLDALAVTKSNKIIPIWYLNIPDTLKFHRPRGYRDSDWVGVKVVNFSATLVNPTALRWDVVLSMIPITEAEKREYFRLDSSLLDGDAYLS